MSSMQFNSSECPSIGVEIEVGLVNSDTMELASACPLVLANIPEQREGTIKPEFMECYIEANSKKCLTMPEVERDLREKFGVIQSVAEAQGFSLLWSGTHPFSSYREQTITDNARYRNLVTLLQDTARQLVTFGVHVHVGVDSGDKAVMICDRILRHLPTLLALSCNSPFWEGRVTGLNSWRSRIMDGLPTAGLPPLMRNWSEYVWLINHLIDTGFIETIREIWWDVRPHHNFGTVETRICDVPGSFDDAMAIASLVHCLIKALSDDIDHGTYQHDCHPMMIRQNKWRAARYGLEAQLVDSHSYEPVPARAAIRELVDLVSHAAEDLDCVPYLERVLEMTHRPSGAQRQIELYERLGDPVEVVRRMVEESRLAPSEDHAKTT